MICRNQHFFPDPPTSMTENAPNRPKMTSDETAPFPVSQLLPSQLVPLPVSMLSTGSGTSPNSLRSILPTLRSTRRVWTSKSLPVAQVALDHLVPDHNKAAT